jgi:predicted RNase H-like nuclease
MSVAAKAIASVTACTFSSGATGAVSEPRFLGIDLAWSRGASGVCALEDGRLLNIAAEEDVLAWADQWRTPNCIVAIDAPTIIRNSMGMRTCEKQVHSRYGRRKAGCYPANLGLPFAGRVLAVSEGFLQRGFRHGAAMPVQAAGAWMLEVFPSAAAAAAFQLPHPVPYKRGRLAQRRLALQQWREMLQSLTSSRLPEIGSTGPQVKGTEDQLDAFFCAWIAQHWWRKGLSASEVFGNEQEGFIVIPHEGVAL